MSSEGYRAAYLDEPRANPVVVRNAPAPPAPSATQVLIKTHAIAINPVDHLIQQTGMIVPADAYPYILGNDVAGEVLAVGSGVTKVSVGDRVVACAESGTFASHVLVPQDLLTIIPDNITFTAASVLPLGLCTAAVMLFQKDTLALDLPRVTRVPNGKFVIAWGAASSVGTNGMQTLRAAGYDVAAVASASNAGYCRDLGAEYVFDYRDGDIANKIMSALKGKPFGGIFCPIATPDVIETCVKLAEELGNGPQNKIVATSLPHSMPYAGSVPDGITIGYCWGDSLKHNEVGPAIWDKWLSSALANGSMQCKPDPTIVGQGLEHVQVALDEQAKGVSAKKLVVEL